MMRLKQKWNLSLDRLFHETIEHFFFNIHNDNTVGRGLKMVEILKSFGKI